MPVQTSIHWKPLRNPHYVVASLQPGQGGRRQIFIKQAALVQVQALARSAPSQPVIGLLVGQRFECPVTETNYVLIESLIEAPAHAHDADTIAVAIRQLIGRHRSHASMETVGWYCTTRSAESYVSKTHAAIHSASFPEPWQTVLVVAERGGAFFLHDRLQSCWFHTPFYEVIEPTRRRPAAKPTCVTWPEYLTTDSVVSLPRTQISAPTQVSAPPQVSAPTQVSAPAPQPRVAAARKPRRSLRRLAGVASAFWKSAWTWARGASSRLFHRGISPRAAAARASATRSWRSARKWIPDASARLFAETISPRAAAVRGSVTSFTKSVADRATVTAQISAERLKQIRAARAAKAAASRTERQSAPALAARKPASPPTVIASEVAELEDTAPSDHVYRYLALARKEGFAVEAKFETASSEHAETLWVLTEPDSGLLLTIVTRGLDVLGANLQYNLRTEDDALLQATSAEHRDLDSWTIFTSEPCVDQLRARCRRLRATGMLEREWKVAPCIHLLTPSDQQSGAARFDEPYRRVSTLRSLSRQRIESLPEHVKRQFRLALHFERAGTESRG
jgi:hypothetical protein